MISDNMQNTFRDEDNKKNMQVTFKEDDIKESLKNIVFKDTPDTPKDIKSKDKLKDIPGIGIDRDAVDIVVLEVPDNRKDEAEDWGMPIKGGQRIETNIPVWLSGASLEDEIRRLTLKPYNEVEVEELCSSIEQLLRENGNETVFSSMKSIGSGMNSGSAGNYFLLIVVGLKKTVSGYAELAKYIVEEIKEKLENAEDFLHMSKSEYGRKRLFANLRKKWILFGSFAEHYMEERGLPDPEVLIGLSAAPYEGSESEARIYFSHQALNMVEVFQPEGGEDREINANNLRMLRKLMEISKRNALYLYAERQEKNKFYTITKLVQCREQTEEDIYVKFSGSMHWSLFEGEREVFRYHNGTYVINVSKEDQPYVKEIEELKDADKQMIRELVEILRRQKHGAVAVVFDEKTDAVKEVNRLCEMKRGIRICSNIHYDKIAGWDEEQILSVTGIDGALFIDYKGRCLAVGVIVDGQIEIEGDVGRGARYNSIRNYMRLNPNCVGIVVSEDGMVNVIQNP